MSILKNIPVIDRDTIPNYVWKMLSEDCFGDNTLNAYQIFYLEDNDDNSSAEQVTKWLRINGITQDRVLIDNTW